MRRVAGLEVDVRGAALEAEGRAACGSAVRSMRPAELIAVRGRRAVGSGPRGSGRPRAGRGARVRREAGDQAPRSRLCSSSSGLPRRRRGWVTCGAGGRGRCRPVRTRSGSRRGSAEVAGDLVVGCGPNSAGGGRGGGAAPARADYLPGPVEPAGPGCRACRRRRIAIVVVARPRRRRRTSGARGTGRCPVPQLGAGSSSRSVGNGRPGARHVVALAVAEAEVAQRHHVLDVLDALGDHDGVDGLGDVAQRGAASRASRWSGRCRARARR